MDAIVTNVLTETVETKILSVRKDDLWTLAALISAAASPLGGASGLMRIPSIAVVPFTPGAEWAEVHIPLSAFNAATATMCRRCSSMAGRRPGFFSSKSMKCDWWRNE